jgi:hemerythrin
MVFEWSHRYSVDVRDVDEQHQHFMDIVNALYEAMERDEGPQVLGKTLDALFEHADAHFKLEQKYMRECRYPETDRHVAEHDEFRQIVGRLRDKAQVEDPKMFTVRLAAFLRDWLVDHVQKEDKRLFEYRASVRPPPKP